MNENGQTIAKHLLERKATAVNSHYNAGPTYVNRANVGKTIDYIFLPVRARQNVSACQTWRRTTSAVAASPYVVDHIALVMTIYLGQRNGEDDQHHVLWDRNLLACELREGRVRQEFVTQLDKRLEEELRVNFDRCEQDDTPDRHNQLFFHALAKAGK